MAVRLHVLASHKCVRSHEPLYGAITRGVARGEELRVRGVLACITLENHLQMNVEGSWTKEA